MNSESVILRDKVTSSVSFRKEFYFKVKRLFDVLFSFIALLVFCIPMLLIGIAIKLESTGPIFFKQLRTGKDGKNFWLYKFRSMSVDNDVMNFNCENKTTKVGAFIRKISLDELPQFINILKGEMSFIGPRPWITEYYECFNKEQKRRCSVLPGITGLAQTVGRNNLTVFDKIRTDLKYVDNCSFKMDIKIIFLTIKTLFLRDGVEISKTGIKEELDALKRRNGVFPTEILDIKKKKNTENDSIIRLFN